MDSELEVIRTEMETTRGSLAQKIGELESQVRDTVSEAGHAVEATKEGVMDVVSSVTESLTARFTRPDPCNALLFASPMR